MDRIAEITSFTVPPRWIFVRVRTAEGLTGWGEAIIPKRRNAVIGAIRDLTQVVLGMDPARIEDIASSLRKGSFFRNGPILGTAIAAIEIALWDIKGQRAGLPVFEVLGGRVRDNIRSYTWIGGARPANVVSHAKERVEQGFDAVKMNATPAVAHLEWREATENLVQRMGSLRDAFGGSIDIALDFHGRVPRSVLKQMVKEIEPFDPLWIEEPFLPEHAGADELMARICPHIPIATGERLLHRWDFQRLLERGGVDVIQPDISITGLFEMEKIARLAEIYDVGVAPHCPNGPISLAASLQVDFCCANTVIQEQSLGLHYNQGYAGLPPADILDYIGDPDVLTTRNGRFDCPSAPGLGLILKGDTIEAAHTDWSLPDPDWRHRDGVYAEW